MQNLKEGKLLDDDIKVMETAAKEISAKYEGKK